MKQNYLAKFVSLMVTLAVLGLLFLSINTSANEDAINLMEINNTNESVNINESNFPDEIFRNWILENIEGASDSILTEEELSKVTEMYLNGNYGLKDLKGIEYFTSLKILYCPVIALEKIDTSKNTELKELYIQFNCLTSLDVTNNSKLEILDCSMNRDLERLTLGKKEALVKLDCHGDLASPLTSIDVTQCPNLKYLDCSGCSIESVDVSKNVVLEEFLYSNNKITMIDISQNSMLLQNEFGHSGGKQRINIKMLKSDNGYESEKEFMFDSNVTFSNNALEYRDNKLFINKVTKDMTCTFDVQRTTTTAELFGTLYFTSDTYFEPVTSLENVTQNIVAQKPTILDYDIQPTNATKQNVIWSIKDAGTTKATIENNQVFAKQSGTLILTATIKDGSIEGDYTQDFIIEVAKPKEHTVTFDLGNGDAFDVIVEEQDKAKMPTPPIKDGFIFEGWYQDSEYQIAWNFDTLITKDYRLYAKWKKIPMVEAVTSNKPSGSVDKNSQITLHSNTKGASIYYTVDGSMPTNRSILYTKPITITNTVTIKAIAIKNQQKDSIVSTFHYTIKEGIKKIDIQSHNENSIELINESEVLEAILTKEDFLAQQAGKNIFVTLKCTPLKQSTIPLDRSIVSDMVVGQYIDIKLLKQIEDDYIQEMTDLSKPIKIKLEIPENLLRQDRKYKVVRFHEGEWTILEDLDDDSNTITIASDKFSVYAIVYQDEIQDTTNHTNPINSNTISISTNDSSQIDLYIVLGCFSFTLFMYILYKMFICNNDKIL